MATTPNIGLSSSCHQRQSLTADRPCVKANRQSPPLADHRNITLEPTEPARAFVAREGFDRVCRARPLKRLIRRELETRIGRALIAGAIPDGTKITVDLEGVQLRVCHGNAAKAVAQ